MEFVYIALGMLAVVLVLAYVRRKNAAPDVRPEPDPDYVPEFPPSREVADELYRQAILHGNTAEGLADFVRIVRLKYPDWTPPTTKD